MKKHADGLPLVRVPGDLITAEGSWPKVLLQPYQMSESRQKNVVHLDYVLINFLIEGHKTVLQPEAEFEVAAGQLVILSPGAMLTSELIAENGCFQSVLLYVDPRLIAEVQTQTVLASAQRHHAVFDVDDYLLNFRQSLQLLSQVAEAADNKLLEAKARELLLYLLTRQAAALNGLSLSGGGASVYRMTQVVTQHALKTVSIEELAFLCHMSLSGFKRAFKAHYGLSPGKWLLERRLEQALVLLKAGTPPSQVYHQVGYQDHSSFSQAFRKRYGYSPSQQS